MSANNTKQTVKNDLSIIDCQSTHLTLLTQLLFLKFEELKESTRVFFCHETLRPFELPKFALGFETEVSRSFARANSSRIVRAVL